MIRSNSRTELWWHVPGYDDVYSVSSKPRLLHRPTGSVVDPYEDEGGGGKVYLKNDQHFDHLHIHDVLKLAVAHYSGQIYPDKRDFIRACFQDDDEVFDCADIGISPAVMDLIRSHARWMYTPDQHSESENNEWLPRALNREDTNKCAWCGKTGTHEAFGGLSREECIDVLGDANGRAVLRASKVERCNECGADDFIARDGAPPPEEDPWG